MHTFVKLTIGQTEFSSLDRVCIPCSAQKVCQKLDLRLNLNKMLSYRRETALQGAL